MEINESISNKISLKPLISGASKFIEKQFVASEKELLNLSKRFGLIKLESFEVKIKINRTVQAERFVISGILKAIAIQSCVVTLEPVQTNINSSFDLYLFQENLFPEQNSQYQEYELYHNDEVDVGEVSAAELGLLLDPYPRKPGANLNSVCANLEGIEVYREKEVKSLQRNNIQNSFSVLADFHREE